jgi:ribosomal protein S18 acetylase RimI-like enzyme
MGLALENGEGRHSLSRVQAAFPQGNRPGVLRPGTCARDPKPVLTGFLLEALTRVPRAKITALQLGLFLSKWKESLKTSQNISAASKSRTRYTATCFELKAAINSETDRNMTSLIRQASLADVEQITAVINRAFRRAEGFFIETDRIDLESVQSLFQRGQFFLAESEGPVAACVYVELRGERAYLGLLSVDPAHQQSGLGSLLMTAAEESCRAHECRFMDIQVVNLREDLFGFYRKRGYVETGIHPFPPEIKTKLPVHFVGMTKELIAL